MAHPHLECIPRAFSKQSDSVDQLKANEVLIAVSEIKGGASLDLSLLSTEEQNKAQSTVDSKARHRFVAGRTLIRETLSPWLGIDSAGIELVVSESGKPFVKQEPSLHFSISHSGEMVLAAFARAEIGVDLERQRPVESEALARRFFSMEEAQHLVSSMDQERREEEFFRLWTAREAAIKGDGRGMGALLGSTRVILPVRSTSEEVLSTDSLQVMIGEQCWTVIPWSLRGGYQAALAFRQSPSLIHWRDLR